MRRIGIVLAFLAAVFLVGALASPLVFWSVQAVTKLFPIFQPLAANPFPRFVSRVLMIVALAGLWPLHCALGKPSWRELGLNFTGTGRRALVIGFCSGLIALSLLTLIALVVNAREWRTVGGEKLATTIILSVLGAMFAAPLEEIIFRGVMFGCLRSRGHWLGALIVSSLVFAAVHFLQTPKDIGEVKWHSGFEVLAAMFTGGAAENRLPQFVNLALCGALLAWAYQRAGSLAFSIGLHAAWILGLKLINAFTLVTTANAFWGSRKMIDGWAATLLLILLAIALPWFTRHQRDETIHVPAASKATRLVG